MAELYNEAFMREALKMAKEAYDDGEVPVGAVVVRNGEIISRGRNRRETAKNALLHAETDAIDKACRALQGWRLWNCELYVTLEPCPMCAGAIINAHIPYVFYGADDFKNGSCGTVTNLFDLPYSFKPKSYGGYLKDECSAILSEFFKKLR